jgi:hypothetical protein
MDIKVTLALLKKSKLSPDMLVMLQLLYYKKFDDIAIIFGKTNSINLRNKLIVTTGYILSHYTVKFTETTVSNKEIEKLFDIRRDRKSTRLNSSHSSQILRSRMPSSA